MERGVSGVRVGVVLIGHGVPATDCPPELVGELMALEWAGDHRPAEEAGRARERARELDLRIRSWPRRPGNDPYKEGLERVAAALKPLLPTDLLAVGYNEFCRPTVQEAIEEVIRLGARRVLVVPSMLTPGGLHSERDIPQAVEEVRARHPEIEILYLWPFDVREVARLLGDQVRRALGESAGSAGA